MKNLNQKIAFTFIAIFSLYFSMNAHSIDKKELPFEKKIVELPKMDIHAIHTIPDLGPLFSSKLIDVYPIPSTGSY